MARFVARSAWDTFRLNLNVYERNLDDDEFLDDVNYELAGRTHEDAYLVNVANPVNDLILGVLGHGLDEDSTGAANGIVNALVESTVSGATSWFADGFSISARALEGVARTVGNGDDRALLRTILSGDDIIKLSRGNDRIEAGAGDDTVRAGSGHDVVFAGSGDDIILGASGGDRLCGGTGSDRINGGSGHDRIFGQAGNDDLTGGTGADVFVFAHRFGTDRIRDFDPDQRGEQIDLGGVARITDFRDLRLHHLDQRGDDVVIDAGNGDSIRLLDLSIDDLSANDFIF